MMDKKMEAMMAIVPGIGLDYVLISLLLFIKRWWGEGWVLPTTSTSFVQSPSSCPMKDGHSLEPREP